MTPLPSLKATALQLLRFVQPYRFRFVLSLVCAALFGIIAAGPTYLLKHVVDDLFIKQHATLIAPFCLAFVVLFSLKGLFMYLSSYLMHWVSSRVTNDIRFRLFEALLQKPTEFFATRTSGQLLSHFLNDIAMMQQAANLTIRDGVRSFFEAVFLTGFAVYQSWQLGALMLLVAPLLGFTVRKVGRARKRASFAIQEQNRHLANTLQESFTGIRAIKAFNAQAFETNRFGDRLVLFFRATMANLRIEALAPACVEAIAALGCSVVFYVAARQVLTGTLSGGQLSAFVAATLLAYQPLKKLINVYSELQYGLTAARTLFEIINQHPTDEATRTGTLAPFKDTITFQDVSVGYRPGQPILQNITLSIRKGQRIGIVGPSGAGKSTLCDLLLGFLKPMSGALTIDGQDITTLSYESLRNQLGYVSQTSFLFNESIANNVAYAKQDATPVQIKQACVAAYAHDFISEMEQGYQTMAGENGARLSGGQKQRITIARALIKDPAILIFDEPTSALDEESERTIAQAIDHLGMDKTIIIVSHRPRLLARVDQLFLVDRGTVAPISNEALAYNQPSKLAHL